MSEPWLWWRDGVIYQIYPRSFKDSGCRSDFPGVQATGTGDLQGIISKLDYLKTLGVDGLWLSPIFPSPDVDFGYDVSDYTAIDPRYGTMEDFDTLVAQAHRCGLHIMLDLVLNHTSDQHTWFQESRSSREHPRRDWYLWRDPRPGGGPPNNWQSIFGGSGWELDPQTSQYYFHMFYKQQPDLNWRNPEVRQAILNVFRFWLDRGVDGFRLDVFNAYFKHLDFPDNPPKFGWYGFERQCHVNDIDQPEMLPLLKEIRHLLDSYPERYVVGETFLSTAEQTARYCGTESLHSAFDFEFLECGWNPRKFLDAIQGWEHALPPDAWPNYVLSNHDVRRTASRYAHGEKDARLKVAAALLLTQRGTPFIYQGEEIGMRDIQVSRSQIQDPVGKRFWPFYGGRDGCRAPMQWDSSEYAGFSAAKPWLPIHPDFKRRNVASQQGDPDSLFNFFQRLIELRKQYPALRTGMFIPLTYEPQSVFGYVRKTADQTVLVALNFSRRKVSLVLGGEISIQDWRLLYSTHRESIELTASRLLRLQPYEVCLLVQV